MGMIASQITSVTIVYSTTYSGADQREHQSSASLALVRIGEFPGQMAVTRKMFPFDDIIMSRWLSWLSWTNFEQDGWHCMASLGHNELTHWGQGTHVCFSRVTIIGSDNGLSPGQY